MIWEFYKKVIAETIWAARKNFGEGFMCKSMVLLYLSAINFMNYLFVLIVLIDPFEIKLNVDFFQIHLFDEQINRKINGFLNFILPFIIVNYFLVFHKKRYKKILKQYPKPGIKYMTIYFMGSFILFMGYIVIGKLMA